MRPILLAPHNDDETLFASFLCIRHQPLVVVCYRSKLQEVNGVTAQEREAETNEALLVLGCTLWTQWPWLDDDDHVDELEANMWGLLDPVSDDVPKVFAPAYLKGGHPQHNLVGDLAVSVFGIENVTRYTTYEFGGARQLGREVPPGPGMIEAKLRALACYESQLRGGPKRMWLDFGLREYVL